MHLQLCNFEWDQVAKSVISLIEEKGFFCKMSHTIPTKMISVNRNPNCFIGHLHKQSWEIMVGSLGHDIKHFWKQVGNLELTLKATGCQWRFL